MEPIVRSVTKNLMRSLRYFVSSVGVDDETFGYTESTHFAGFLLFRPPDSPYSLSFVSQLSGLQPGVILSSEVWVRRRSPVPGRCRYSLRANFVRNVTTRTSLRICPQALGGVAELSGRAPKSLGVPVKNKALKSALQRPENQSTGHTGPSGSQCRNWQTLATDAGSTGLYKE